MHRSFLTAALFGLALTAAGFSLTHRVAIVCGGSMEPALSSGDLCVVRRGGSPRSGDVALFDHRGGPVLHRVISARSDGSLLTRGDANAACDRDPVPKGAVRGKVVGVVRASWLLDGVSRLRSSCATLTARTP